MSYKILTPAWDACLPVSQKIILISLADQANDHGYCWPSVATLERRTGLSTRAIYKNLADLEQAGHITRKHRSGHSTIYVVHPNTNAHNSSHTPAPDAYLPLHQVHTTPAPDAPITVIEP